MKTRIFMVITGVSSIIVGLLVIFGYLPYTIGELNMIEVGLGIITIGLFMIEGAAYFGGCGCK